MGVVSNDAVVVCANEEGGSEACDGRGGKIFCKNRGRDELCEDVDNALTGESGDGVRLFGDCETDQVFEGDDTMDLVDVGFCEDEAFVTVGGGACDVTGVCEGGDLVSIFATGGGCCVVCDVGTGSI